MPTIPRLRVPARLYEWFDGSDAATALEYGDTVSDPMYAPEKFDPDRLSAYRKIFDTPSRADGSTHVAGLTADELDALKWDAEHFAMLAADNLWNADGRAELNAARAMLRAIEKVSASLDAPAVAS